MPSLSPVTDRSKATTVVVPQSGVTQPKTSREEEEGVPLSMVLKTLRADSDLSDLTLEGTDGERVPANRCILAVRSIVFRRMLFGQYSEASRSVVTLGCSGRVLRGIVDYCYADHPGIFDEDCADDSWARAMVQLAAASDYFGLPFLGDMVLDRARSAIRDEPALSCSFFDESEAAETAGGDAGRQIHELALDTVRSRTRAALLPPASSTLNGIVSLTPAALSKILQDSRLETDEFHLFCALKEWSDADESVMSMTDQGDWSTYSWKRKDIAAELAKHIHLTRIKPSDLVGTVIPSGLVSSDRLAEAFKTQALLFEQKCVCIPTFRAPCWKNSNSTLLQCKKGGILTNSIIECGPMTSGVHSWSIEVKEVCGSNDWFDEFGVVCSTQSLSAREGFASKANGGWIYDQRGRAYHGGKKVSEAGQPIVKGSIIRFTLDLTSGGSLTATVGENKPWRLFDDMLSQLGAVQKPSFLPAVSLKQPASVRFLGFEAMTMDGADDSELYFPTL